MNFDIKKYLPLLYTSYKDEMLSQIKRDLKESYQKMSDIELNSLSINIYISCTLECHNIDILTIFDFLAFVDNYYYIQNGESEIETTITNENSIHLRTIQQKYIDEIRKQI